MVVLVKVIGVKFINNKVEIIFDKKTISISKENYIENPITIDSFIDENKIEFLLNQERIIESKIEMVKILNKKALTELEVKKKLYEKGLKKEDIDSIIASLKRAGLINDEYAGMLLVDSMLIKRKGKLEIYKKLKEKGIGADVSNKLVSNIDDQVYEDNFNKVCDKCLKMYSNKSFKLKEQLVISKLKEKGYEEEYINRINIDRNNEEELNNAKKILIKLMKNKKANELDNENLYKIKSKLVNKGYNCDIINIALEEVINDETD